MANLPKKKVYDTEGNEVLPITHVSAVYDNNGTSVETLLINMDEKIDNKIIEGYYIDGDFYTTPPITHDYIEIDGVKWATMNLGAQSETDYGLYFQWGDTQGYTAAQVGEGEGQKYFSEEDCKYGPIDWNDETNYGLTKYNNTDGLTTLQASDDAVTAAWGGNWRMPTKDEYVALGEAVTYARTADYQGSGVAGVVLTSNADGATLFFPACGNAYYGSVSGAGNYGGCWSSSLNADFDDYSAYNFYFGSGDVNWNDSNSRDCGFPVRAIYDGSTPTAITPILGALYIDKVTNVIYRYDGSAYVQLSAAPVSNSYIEAMWSGYDPLASE